MSKSPITDLWYRAITIAIVITYTPTPIASQVDIQTVAGHSAIWIDIGKVYTTTWYAHLHIPIRTDNLKKRQIFMESINQRFQIPYARQH